MHFVATTELRQPKAWDRLHHEKAVVTSHGKPIAMLIPIDEDSFEDTLEQVNRLEALRSLRTLQAEAKESGANTMSLDEINAEIGASRKERRARRL
jgi:antitoxin (DNA-binding transcriptional repressor) of toxin-antitoxin stability system